MGADPVDSTGRRGGVRVVGRPLSAEPGERCPKQGTRWAHVFSRGCCQPLLSVRVSIRSCLLAIRFCQRQHPPGAQSLSSSAFEQVEVFLRGVHIQSHREPHGGWEKDDSILRPFALANEDFPALDVYVIPHGVANLGNPAPCCVQNLKQNLVRGVAAFLDLREEIFQLNGREILRQSDRSPGRTLSHRLPRLSHAIRELVVAEAMATDDATDFGCGSFEERGPQIDDFAFCI